MGSVAAVSGLYLQSFFNATYAGLGTLPDGPQVKLSERSSAQLDGRPGGNAGGGQLKTWTRTIQEDLARSRRIWGLWPTTMELGVASDLHRDDPGPPCMVRDREGCRQSFGGRPDPTRMLAASVTVIE